MAKTKKLTKRWGIRRVGADDLLFESDDPQAIVNEAHRLEQEATDEGPLEGMACGSYAIEGDPIELGVAQTGRVDPEGFRQPEVA